MLQTPQPRPDALAGTNAAQIKHGRYLVELIGCGACHTDGAIVGTWVKRDGRTTAPVDPERVAALVRAARTD